MPSVNGMRTRRTKPIEQVLLRDVQMRTLPHTNSLRVRQVLSGALTPQPVMQDDGDSEFLLVGEVAVEKPFDRSR